MDMEYLKYLYRSRGISLEELGETLEMSVSCLYSRFKGKTDWNVGEIRKIRDILELTDEQIRKVFGI